MHPPAISHYQSFPLLSYTRSYSTILYILCQDEFIWISNKPLSREQCVQNVDIANSIEWTSFSHIQSIKRHFFITRDVDGHFENVKYIWNVAVNENVNIMAADWRSGTITPITRFMWPTWGPPGPCWPQVGPMNLAIREVAIKPTDNGNIIHIHAEKTPKGLNEKKSKKQGKTFLCVWVINAGRWHTFWRDFWLPEPLSWYTNITKMFDVHTDLPSSWV